MRCFKGCNCGSLLLVIWTRTWSFGYLSKKLKEQNKCVGKLDENIYGFVGMAIHPQTNIRNFWFQIMGLWLFEGWPLDISQTYTYAYLCIFWVASDVIQGVVNKYDVNGLAIWLWKFNNQGCPKPRNGVPILVPFHPIWGNDASKLIEKEKFISNGISKYLEFWKLNFVRDEMYTKAMGPYIEYWEGTLKCLLKSPPKQSPILLEGLWPSSNWKVSHVWFHFPISPILEY